jgi:dTDP-4-dehydrorhamnose reductase
VRILITGKDGQVGHALIPALAALGEVIGVGRGECDLADPAAVERAVRAAKPDIIVNPAAYTAVDKAESERDQAFAVNARAPGILAALAAERDIPLIHYSTDYVYDGAKSAPYVESDATNPLSVYGASKLEGENAIRAILPRHVILRTSWVFGDHGGNFLKTMLRLGRERETLNVVADQFGAPTSTDLIAWVTARIASKLARGDGPHGIYHLAAAGETSWHGYASFLFEAARARGFPLAVRAVNPIPATAYPTPAVRPANSRLDTARLKCDFALALSPWQDGVARTVEKLRPL